MCVYTSFIKDTVIEPEADDLSHLKDEIQENLEYV